MSWQESIAEISVAGESGSGFVVAPDRVLTAAHVIAAAGTSGPPVFQIHCQVGGVPVTVAGYTIHSRWRTQGYGSGDMAVLRLAAPVSAPPLATLRNYRPGPTADCGAGCPQGVMTGPVTVRLDRRAQAAGYDMFWGVGLVAPLGISGGPLLRGDGTDATAVGVVTCVASSPTASVFIGLPLLDLTYGQLVDQP